MTTTTPWPRHYGDRLLRLAKFLEKLPRRKFDFAEYVNTAVYRGKECGTVCCAIGWTPAVFPRMITWDRIRRETVEDVADRLFGLTVWEASDLFIPVTASRVWCPKGLDTNATPKQVARSIRAFVAWKRGQAR